MMLVNDNDYGGSSVDNDVDNCFQVLLLCSGALLIVHCWNRRTRHHVKKTLVRFPAPLATGSGSGFQYPKKWEIFLWGLLAQPFGDAQGWVGSYWVRTDLSSLWRQFEFPHFTQCCCSLAFMSPSQSSLRHPPNPHFVFLCISTCISQLHLYHISKSIFFSCAYSSVFADAWQLDQLQIISGIAPEYCCQWREKVLY